MKSQSPATKLSKAYKNEISVLLRFLLGETVTSDPAGQSLHPAVLHEIAENHRRFRQTETIEPNA